METGSQITSFSAPASTGQTLSSDAYLGKTPMALFFLDGDESTDELSAVNERLAQFGAMRIQALGIAKVTAAEARRMSEEHDWNLPVLADASGTIRRQFDVEAGRTPVIVVSSDGEVVHIDDSAASPDRPASVVSLLNDLKNDGRLTRTARK